MSDLSYRKIVEIANETIDMLTVAVTPAVNEDGRISIPFDLFIDLNRKMFLLQGFVNAAKGIKYSCDYEELVSTLRKALENDTEEPTEEEE